MAGYEYHYAPAVMPDGRDMPEEGEKRLQGRFRVTSTADWQEWIDRLVGKAEEIGVEIEVGFDAPQNVTLPFGWELRKRDDGVWILVYTGEDNGEAEKGGGSTGSGSDSSSSSALLFVGLAILLVVLVK